MLSAYLLNNQQATSFKQIKINHVRNDVNYSEASLARHMRIRLCID